ncbi:MAG: hypothetical protein GC131_06765 [Alphaproteobacteria bacterium]|nr:hypothetical protein [Alphaproteobacteria bacterium]
MPQTGPILIAHRRNRLADLAAVARGNWVEVDIELHEGEAYLAHDPLPAPPGAMDPPPARLKDYMRAAQEAGIAGFVFDCKREGAAAFVMPHLRSAGIKNYFFLNETEVSADIVRTQNDAHVTALRLWQYRGADELARYIEDTSAPLWVWVDCWARGLTENIARAHLPFTPAQAAKLRGAGARLCICSPELYAHRYGQSYVPGALAAIYRGVLKYRARLEKENIAFDAVCSKFPGLWSGALGALAGANEADLLRAG